EGVGFLAEVRVVDKAVGIVVRERSLVPDRVRISDRPAAHDLRLPARTRVVAEPEAALEFIPGFLRRDDDRAADGIAPVDRALGAYEYLDLLDVEQLLRELRRVRHQHAVYEHGDRGLAVPCLRNAADRDEGVA